MSDVLFVIKIMNTNEIQTISLLLRKASVINLTIVVVKIKCYRTKTQLVFSLLFVS